MSAVCELMGRTWIAGRRMKAHSMPVVEVRSGREAERHTAERSAVRRDAEGKSSSSFASK